MNRQQCELQRLLEQVDRQTREAFAHAYTGCENKGALTGFVTIMQRADRCMALLLHDPRLTRNDVARVTYTRVLLHRDMQEVLYYAAEVFPPVGVA